MGFDSNKIGKEYMLGIQKFTYNRSQYLKKNHLEVNDETRRQIADNYKVSIYKVVTYLNKLFKEGFINSEGTIEISFEKLLNGVGEDTRMFLEYPTITCTLYPVVEDSEAQMSFVDGYLEEAENLETISGLPRKYRTKHLNSLLEGYSIEAVRELLKELHVLPEINLLDEAIDEEYMRLEERYDFINNVILRLLLNGNEEDITRAYIFDYFMGSHFDFDSYKEEKKRTK